MENKPTYEELERRCREYERAISTLGFFVLPFMEAAMKVRDGYNFSDFIVGESKFAKEYEEWRKKLVQDN